MTISYTPPAFALPAALVCEGYALRPETDDDIPFLTRLYGTTREQELATVDWTPEQKDAFVEHQFNAQRIHYRGQIAGCAFDVIEKHGVPVGRLYLQERESRLHIVDIALMPEWCGKGLGSAILHGLIEAAGSKGKGVGIFVEKYNPALRLYRRLGFTEIQDTDIYLEMEWVPEGYDAPLATTPIS
ncbi:GNAT family N-acetyltransferase [Sphingomonas oligophenolica]|uniref:GNAT family N-acetyltransferase n=1 Tax=Sphingomonas oligophenolica TaxID=301154 RepID=A0ABU9XZL4_9SPHN